MLATGCATGEHGWKNAGLESYARLQYLSSSYVIEEKPDTGPRYSRFRNPGLDTCLFSQCLSGNMNNSVMEGSGVLLYSRLLRGFAGDIFMV